MIYIGSILPVCDNSGIKKVKCIKILRKSARKCGKAGDTLIVVIKSIKRFKKIKKKDIYKALLVRCRKKIVRSDGSCIAFGENAVVLLNKKMVPLGTRIFGPVAHELRLKKNTKLVTLAKSVI